MNKYGNGSLSKDKIWIIKALSHQETEQVPYRFDFTPPARARLEKFYNSTLIEDKIRLPICWGGPNTTKPLYADPKTYGKYVLGSHGRFQVMTKGPLFLLV